MQRLPDLAQRYGRWVAAALIVAGCLARSFGGIGPGVAALWCFSLAAVVLALTLPLSYAFVSPLYMGVFGWVIDMLPFVILAGWSALAVRLVWPYLRDRKLPDIGRWVWLPLGILIWTALGVLVISKADFKHFLLLLGIQFVASAALLGAAIHLREREARDRTVSGLLLFVIVLSVGVTLEWIGLPLEEAQDTTARRAVEEAYGVDAFPNSIGMIKYARSIEAGALELRRELDAIAPSMQNLPPYEVFRPRLQAFENSLVVRFGGSARDHAEELSTIGVDLLFDNIGLAPANTVPRLRSFPRNALTYAGVCAAIFPLAIGVIWTAESRRRKWFARIAAASCLYGAGFSLARGSWVAILIGCIYLFLHRRIGWRKVLGVSAAVLAAALVLSSFFLIRYGVDPLRGRAGGGSSVATRFDLYDDTLGSLKGIYLIFGYGTEQPRTESGTVKEGTRYVPRAGTHSTYLNYLFRTGVPGALAIMSLYGIAILSRHARAHYSEGEEQLWAVAIATAAVIAAAHGVILSLYVEPTYTLTIMLVMGLALSAAGPGGPPLLPWRKPVTGRLGERSE